MTTREGQGGRWEKLWRRGVLMLFRWPATRRCHSSCSSFDLRCTPRVAHNCALKPTRGGRRGSQKGSVGGKQATAPLNAVWPPRTVPSGRLQRPTRQRALAPGGHIPKERLLCGFAATVSAQSRFPRSQCTYLFCTSTPQPLPSDRESGGRHRTEPHASMAALATGAAQVEAPRVP